MRDGYNTTQTGEGYGYNKIFQDYDDLVTQLNKANTNGTQSTIQNDISFSVDPYTQRIVFIGASSQYYYMPLGFNDPNLPQNSTSAQNTLGVIAQIGSLQQRLGFSWDGMFPPTTPVVAYTPGLAYTSYISGVTVWDWALGTLASSPIMNEGGTAINLIFNAYANLVYSPTVSVYTNIVFTSTVESSETNTNTNGLLQVIPVNTNQLGISFFQSTFNRPLRKVAEIVDNIQIVLLTDRGLPYWIPNGTNVSIELGFSYE